MILRTRLLFETLLTTRLLFETLQTLNSLKNIKHQRRCKKYETCDQICDTRVQEYNPPTYEIFDILMCF